MNLKSDTCQSTSLMKPRFLAPASAVFDVGGDIMFLCLKLRVIINLNTATPLSFCVDYQHRNFLRAVGSFIFISKFPTKTSDVNKVVFLKTLSRYFPQTTSF